MILFQAVRETPRQKSDPKNLPGFGVTPRLTQHIKNGSEAGHNWARLLLNLLPVLGGLDQ
jgi:hypothetical protein